MNHQDIKPKLHFQRFEFKYFVPEELIEPIKQDLLKNSMKWDPHLPDSHDGQYEVRSLYYDTPGLAAYWDKEAGAKIRKKHRLRVYSDREQNDLPVFIEIKRKYDMLVMKDRLLTNWQNTLKLLTGEQNDYFNFFPSLDKAIVGEFFYDMLKGQMKPVVLIVYDRTPLISDYDEKFRVTFDFNIRASDTQDLFYNDTFIPVLDKGCIMEVKFNNSLDFWFHQLIQKYELSRQPFSKYCHGIEAIGKVKI